ncbi:MAG: hypothetical protein ACP5O7_12755 [Phycisphaerae bacterium]
MSRILRRIADYSHFKKAPQITHVYTFLRRARKILLTEANEVLCSDEYIQDERFVSAEELIRRSDVVMIAAPHKAYKSLDYSGKILVDVWNHVEFGARR